MRKHYGFERAVLKELTLNLPLTSVSKLTDFFWSGRDLNDNPKVRPKLSLPAAL